MKYDKIYNVLIIIVTILIIFGTIYLIAKKDYGEEEIIPIDKPIITPIDIPREPEYEEINFSVGMIIYYNPVKNMVCDDYKEENSFRGITNGCMKFYGLKQEYGYVNMLLDHDLNTTSTNWASRKDYPNEDTIKKVGISNYGKKEYGTFGNNNCGPVTILRLMMEYTKDWQTSVPDIYNYTDTFSINYNGHKARMMTLNDTEGICQKDSSSNTPQDIRCPEWMYMQLGKSESRLYWGYWLANPSKNSTERAFRITNNGILKDLYVDNDVGGVRPILVIPEDKILKKLIEK